MAKLTGANISEGNFKINEAIGDGVTTVFILTHTPLSSLQMSVLINGLSRFPTKDYNLNGKQITFVVAPELGQEIEFQYIHKDQ